MTSTVASPEAAEVRPDVGDRGHEERKNRKATTPPEQPAASAKQPSPTKTRGRRGRRSLPENVRYFVGKASRNQEAPQLEREVASEAEGLVAAFKSDHRLFIVSEFTVAQHIDGGRVTLGKEPAAPAGPRVSTVNGS